MTSIARRSASTGHGSEYKRFVEHGSALFVAKRGSILRHIGKDALDLLHRITTNSLISLADGEARRTLLTNEKGRIIDSLWVLKRNSEELLLVSDSDDLDATKDGILRYTIIEDAEIEAFDHFLTRWHVAGPKSHEVVQMLLPELSENITDAPCGYLGGADVVEGGVVLAWRSDVVFEPTWSLIASAPAVLILEDRFGDAGLEPARPELFDYLRVITGIPIADAELTDRVNPLEAGLERLIDFEKGCYVGQEVIARLDTYDKVQRKLVAFRSTSSEPDAFEFASGTPLKSVNRNTNAGWITTAIEDLETGCIVGMAFVRKSQLDLDGDLATPGGQRVLVVGARSPNG